MTAVQPEGTGNFSKVRRALWPIHGEELKKFLPMAFMMFCMLFNYTILRNTKDSIIMTESGAEILPFMKGLVVAPFSVLLVMAYVKLSNHLTKPNLFYTTIGTFLAVFILYGLFLFPNRDILHMSDDSIKIWQASYPAFQHFIPLVGRWSTSLFYLFSELWGAMILSLLFWQFANDVTRVYEARRFYGMFAFLGHFALSIAGAMGGKLCEAGEGFSVPEEGFQNYIYYTVLWITVCGLATMATYWWLNKKVLTDPKYYEGESNNRKPSGEKQKLTLTETIRYVTTSPYIGYIAIMVMGYAITINLTGILWKKQLQLAYPTPLAYAQFMNDFAMYVGFTTNILIFFSKGIVERFGWYKGAIITPAILLVTSIFFFAFIFFEEATTPMVAWIGVSPLMCAVMVSSVQQVLCKSAKYSIFDPTKEMTYIPLDQELKVKGKAVVDVNVYSIGKACGGYICGGFLILFSASDLLEITPHLAITVFALIFMWFYAVKRLSVLYYRLVNKKHLDPQGEGFHGDVKMQEARS